MVETVYCLFQSMNIVFQCRYVFVLIVLRDISLNGWIQLFLSNLFHQLAMRPAYIGLQLVIILIICINENISGRNFG